MQNYVMILAAAVSMVLSMFALVTFAVLIIILVKNFGLERSKKIHEV